jgi:hypothetical protein
LGAGIHIWENGLRVLDALGVLRRVIAGVISASCHEKRNHNGSAFASSLLGPNFGNIGFIVPNRRDFCYDRPVVQQRPIRR